MPGEWLFEEIAKIDELLIGKKAEWEEKMDMATKITAGMDDMPHGSDVTDKVANIGVELAEISSEMDALNKRRKKLIKMLESLPADQYGALHRHYIRGMTWEQVAEDMNLSESTVKRRGKEGLEMLEQMKGV